MNVLDLLNKKKEKRLIGWDTETHLITSECISPPMVCLTWWENGEAQITNKKKEAKELLVSWLRDPDVIIVGHNVYYDLWVMCHDDDDLFVLIWKAFEEGRIRDTRVKAKLIAIQSGHLDYDPYMGRKPVFSLEFLIKKYFEVDIEGKHGEDAWRMRYAELDGIPLSKWPQAALDYALLDAAYTGQLYQQLTKAYGVLPDELFQTHAGWCLYLMSAWGINTDIDKIQELENSLRPQINTALQYLMEHGIYRPGKSRPDMGAFREYIKETYSDHPLYKETANGQPSVNAGFLKHLYADNKVRAWVQKDEDSLRYMGLWKEDSPTRDTKAIQAIVSENIENPKLTDSGNISTERDVLECIDDHRLNRLVDIGKAQKIMSTYIPALKKGVTHPIHPYWNVLVASGRVSVSKPNLNNMPREGGVRECFKARDGFIFINRDYSQVELCGLGQICIDKFGFSKMAEAINDGLDLHSLTGSRILEIHYDEFVARYKAGDPEVVEARRLAKIANFGYPGGQGYRSFVDFARQSGVILTPQQSIDLKAIWLNLYPEVNLYFNWVSQQLQYSESFSFKQHRSNRIRGGLGFCDGCNTGFQGIVADGAKSALIDITKECWLDENSPLYGTRVNAFIYDEFLCEAPIDRYEEAGERLGDLMVAGMKRFIPDVLIKVSDTEVYTNWRK